MADGTTPAWKGGTEHWTRKGDIKLFLWNKKPHAGAPKRGTIFFVHGSSMASQPTFDLSVPGRADSPAMDYFAALGYDTWTMDNEGYGRSDKHRAQNNDISNGADDLATGTEYMISITHVISPRLYRQMPYDPIRDFTPVMKLAEGPYVLGASQRSCHRRNRAGL